MRTRLLSAVVLVLACGATVRAAEGQRPLDRTELDRRVVRIVYEAALLGTDVFNDKKHDECYRLYQGTLLAVVPLLDHRPKLVASVKDKLDKAKGMKAAEGAFVLRDALDEIQHEIAPNSKADPKTESKVDPKTDTKVEPKKTTLWDRLGGETGVAKVINDLLVVAIEDPKVNLLRDGKYKLDAKGTAHLKKMLLEMVSEVTGGPLKYTGKDMKSAHAGMKITAEEFDAFAALMADTLKKNKVAKADIDELMKVVGATKASIVEGKAN
ncbi:group I truncated hemoglobin [Gemmata sp.]|uniref:group I truncated hemoglobin n=1 Tax=Gemmata sp. TaxID=1914242 RepID=UPI003F6FD65F